MSGDQRIEALLAETRRFAAPASFAATANVGAEAFAEAAADPDAFWERQAHRLDWAEPWHTVHTWAPARPTGGLRSDGEPELSIPETTWFAGGRLNVAVNCVDRHVAAGRGDKVALHFEGEGGDRRAITYAELEREVARAAHALTGLGIGRGDRVVVYLPVIPETVVITLAIARIGAVHSLVFGGFSAEAVRFRLQDTGAKLLVTSDGQFRRGAAVPVKATADAAAAGLDHVEHVVVVRRTGEQTPGTPWTEGRDLWWHDLVADQPAVHAAEAFDAETPLFIIYTSGTTGKPKGLVHTSGGYLVQASWSHWAVFDAKDDDVHWCTADLAWVTAHTYELYGPLSNGLTQVIYEGTPDSPHRARHFEIIQRYGVTVYYTAPTLIRTLMSWFPEGVPAEYDVSSIRLLGTVGEAINPEAWMWFREHLGRGETPIVDTWWQSETGAAVMAPLPGVSTLKPGSATRALPGLSTLVVDEHGERVPYGGGGLLVVDRPGPGLARTVWGDPQRYLDAYWRTFHRQGYFASGDGAKWDEEGDIWVLGRMDDVINVSGHRLSTIEIESALVAHPEVAEAGVVGVSDPITGQAIAAFVIPVHRPAVASARGASAQGASGARSGAQSAEGSTDARAAPPAEPLGYAAAAPALSSLLREHVARLIGPVAKPAHVVVVPDLPKTRSGKIMRRLLVDVMDSRPLGDVTSLQDETVPERIAAIVAELRG